ncbi:MAG: glycosyltransferase [Gemmatimonadaceae bacterium]|nr:glycosyltransferase [Gemmatimonadaceae bacterium]
MIAAVLATVVMLAAAIGVYAYFGYPAMLVAVAKLSSRRAVHRQPPTQWPQVTITLPAYNAEHTLRPVLEALVAVDYPADRRRILVVSDGSTDGTDDLVRSYGGQGVELLRLEGRLGKTEVENRAMSAMQGEIVVNTDASVTVHPGAVKALVAALGDETVGVASARDISIASVGAQGHASEAAYVGYEMWVRGLETEVDGIIGSSGCLYAARTELHRRVLPGHLSRDFSSALWARLNGYRAVSVDDALCFVPRAASMQVEYRRKIRTMSRGIQTLFYHAQLMDPWRYGAFAWMLLSHKLVRWLVPWCLLAIAIAVPLLGYVGFRDGAPWAALALAVLGGEIACLALAAAGWWWPTSGKPPRLLAAAAYFVTGNVAGIVAWWRALTDQRAPVWEPTPRAMQR